MADVITRFKVESTQYEKKIKDAKKSLNDFGNQSSQASQYLKNLESKLGVNITALTKFSVAAGAVAGALKVAKDAFLATESGIDEWGRTTQSAKALYDGFLQSLNTGDISGYLANIDKIKKAAVDAYNAIDSLGTMKNFSDIDLARLNTEKMALQLAIKQGKANGTDVKALQDQLIGKDEEIERIAREKAQLAKEAYNEVFESIVKNASGGRFDEDIAHRYADTWEGFRNVSDEKIAEIRAEIERLAKEGGFNSNMDNARRLYASGQTIDRETERRALALDQELAMIKAVKAQETKIAEAKQYQLECEQALQQSLQSRLSSQRYLSEGKSGGKSSSSGPVSLDTSKFKEIQPAFANLNKEADALTQKLTVMPDLSIRAFSTGSINDYQTQLKEATDILNGLTIGTKEYADQLAVVKELQANIAEGKNIDESMNLEESLSNLNSLVGKIDSISSSVENLKDVLDGSTNGFKAFMTVIKSSLSILESAAGIMQMLGVFTKAETVAIEGEAAAELTAATAKEAKTAATAAEISGETAATTASGVSAAASGVEASADAASAAAKFMKAHAWIPYVGAAIGGAAITAMIIAINKAKHFADGGIVPGVENGGKDTVSAVLSPGELVLNKSQQANLASHLSDNSRGGQVEFRIKDRELYGILLNYQNRQSNKL